jgi:hypothetical protein
LSLRRKLEEDALGHGLLRETVPLFLRAVAPDDRVGLGETRHLLHPPEQVLVLGLWRTALAG